MVAVPLDTPRTDPVVLTVAMVVAVLLQVPPVAVSVSVMLVPTQTEADPTIVPGESVGSIVIILLAELVSPPATTL